MSDVKDHHKKGDAATNRPSYRDARRDRAVKVYTVNQESKYLLVQNVHALGVTEELMQLFSLYGSIQEYRLLDEYPAEPYTDVYWIKFTEINSARIAKKKTDNHSFFGKNLHVCYAPEYESVQDTREKLQQRRKIIAAKTRDSAADVSKEKSLTHASNTPHMSTEHYTGTTEYYSETTSIPARDIESSLLHKDSNLLTVPSSALVPVSTTPLQGPDHLSLPIITAPSLVTNYSEQLPYPSMATDATTSLKPCGETRQPSIGTKAGHQGRSGFVGSRSGEPKNDSIPQETSGNAGQNVDRQGLSKSERMSLYLSTLNDPLLVPSMRTKQTVSGNQKHGGDVYRKPGGQTLHAASHNPTKTSHGTPNISHGLTEDKSSDVSVTAIRQTMDKVQQTTSTQQPKKRRRI